MDRKQQIKLNIYKALLEKEINHAKKMKTLFSVASVTAVVTIVSFGSHVWIIQKKVKTEIANLKLEEKVETDIFFSDMATKPSDLKVNSDDKIGIILKLK